MSSACQRCSAPDASHYDHEGVLVCRACYNRDQSAAQTRRVEENAEEAIRARRRRRLARPLIGSVLMAVAGLASGPSWAMVGAGVLSTAVFGYLVWKD